MQTEEDGGDDEVLPSEFPPGVNDFVAASNIPAVQDWDLPFIDGRPTRSRTNRRGRDTGIGVCDCRERLSQSERADLAIAVACTKGGCATHWSPGSIIGQNWVCEACRGDAPVKRRRRH
ncbi:hypothetical protein DFH07DRAFT_764717 [Mycena maculata]|uniref:Zinc finger PHD-type domain-containing protein n=1 Tax=Mycena maculata TaxID=230809 RepID=A0AAD7P0F0_9AGAR|nr:hypothetical protein DFH07DRAFT_764717 [Mycena maculata]